MSWVYVISGHLCVAVGVVGIFVPLLPTTPFLLLAAFCYSNGSTKLHGWLLDHPRLGPPVHAWQEYGVITRRAKVLSVALIAASMSYPLIFGDMDWPWKIAAGGVGIGVIGFLLSRPSSAAESRRRREATTTKT